MFYIVGLGNPGEEYELTRHNIGRMAVELLADKLDLGEWKTDKVLDAEKMKGEVGGESVTLVMPNTFMNKSGKSIVPLLNTSGLTKQQIEKKAAKLVVIHDDLDLPLGKVKIVFNRGSGGHNGVESIRKAIKTEAFVRIKIGIVPTTPTGKLKKPKGEKKVVDCILGKFQSAELQVIKKSLKDIPEIISLIVTEGPTAAMNMFN